MVTVTGDCQVVGKDILARLKNGCVIANAGHFDVEIDVAGLKKLATKTWVARPNVAAYQLAGGQIIYLLAEGRLVNLAAAEGHPAAVMDMSFAGQALAARYLVERGRGLAKRVYSLPAELDERIARLKLGSLGIKHDRLTERQKQYLGSWQEGT